MALLVAMWNTSAVAAEISARRLQQNSYELVLTDQSALDERTARAYIANAAVSVCGGLSPVLGRFWFESQEEVGTGLLSREPPSFRFIQEVSCVPLSQTAPARHTPTLKTPGEVERVREDIRTLSEGYFRLMNAGRFDEAYSHMNEAALGTDKASWIRDKQDFQSRTGELISISFIAITVYDNPPEAPTPGLYVAADFQNAYQHVPYECGYLMWFRPEGGTFTITRSEMGHVTAETLNAVPVGQRPEVLRKLRCAAP